MRSRVEEEEVVEFDSHVGLWEERCRDHSLHEETAEGVVSPPLGEEVMSIG